MIEKKQKIIKKRLYIINIAIFAYIFCLSVGYAFFSDSLTINGYANTVDYYSGEKLPALPVVRDTENNRYYTYDVEKKYIEFQSESWVGDTYYLRLDKKTGLVIGERTVNYVVTFTNPTVLPYTDGTVTAEITENYGNRIKEVSASISKTELAPGETVDVTLTVRFNFLSAADNHEVKATVTYMMQNKPRYFYFYIWYD